MTSHKSARQQAGSDRQGLASLIFRVLADFFRQTATILWVETVKIRRDPFSLFTRAVQPVLWLGVFGTVMARTRAIPTGSVGYLEFMVPGVLAQSVLFLSIFYGISLIWEKDLGILSKYLASPAYRPALVTGKALAAGVRALSQAVVVCVLGLLLGARLVLTPSSILGVLFFLMLGAALFSTFSLVIACLVKTRERFMGIGQVLTMPLFFASNAIYPLSVMPGWLRTLSSGNPLTYQVDALRALMIPGARSAMGLGVDFAMEAAVFAVLVGIGSWLYPKSIR